MASDVRRMFKAVSPSIVGNPALCFISFASPPAIYDYISCCNDHLKTTIQMFKSLLCILDTVDVAGCDHL